MLTQQLNAGILLEDDGTLIPWNSPSEVLKEIGSPHVIEAKDVSTFLWQNRRVLCGLVCTITAQLRNSAKPLTSEPADEWIYSAGLRYVHVDPTGAFNSAQAEFDHTSKHLVRVLGQPTIVSEGGGHYPLLKWVFNEVAVTYQIAERFTDYCALQIRHG